jgi:CMP-N,N'-diacetyllegionaminic acid synthase
MIQGKKVLAVIAARGGSKRLRRKNVLETGGKPMVAWSIEAGQGSGYIDRLILSTDDDEIIDIGRRWNCEVPYRRPHDLAGDSAKIEDALIHALDNLEDDFDYLVLLQATSPLRTATDIDACLEFSIESGAPSVITVSEPAKSPYWMFHVDGTGHMHTLIDGVDLPRVNPPTTHVVNGAVFVVRVPWFREHTKFFTPDTLAHIMPPENSVDVDNEIDLLTARAILSSRLDHE